MGMEPSDVSSEQAGGRLLNSIRFSYESVFCMMKVEWNARNII